MRVKDVIIASLGLLGKGDIACKLINGNAALDTGEQEVVDTLLYCFNAAEDEVSRKYVPLIYSEKIKSDDGIYDYVKFVRAPVRIRRVYSDGVSIPFKVFPQYLSSQAGTVTVEYEYSPVKKKLQDLSDYGSEVGEYLFALGAASEYCLINGEIEMSGLWESKYRSAIDGVQARLPVCKNIPPRRWV